MSIKNPNRKTDTEILMKRKDTDVDNWRLAGYSMPTIIDTTWEDVSRSDCAGQSI